MVSVQSAVESNIVAFVSHTPVAARLTSFDRIDIVEWKERAGLAGYDRMVVHDRRRATAYDFGNFLVVHRRGEAWSRWGFTRKGKLVTAWCCLTGADFGEFTSLSAALEAVLPADAPRPLRSTRHCDVTTVSPILGTIGRRFGSAA